MPEAVDGHADQPRAVARLPDQRRADAVTALRRLVGDCLDYTFPVALGVAGWLDAATFGGMSRWLRDAEFSLHGPADDHREADVVPLGDGQELGVFVPVEAAADHFGAPAFL